MEITLLLVAFLTINAIFWGLFPHSTHCKFAALFGVKRCAPHWVHLLIGLVAFLAAVMLKNYTYIKSLM